MFNTGAGNDAFMAFHAGADYAGYFGLDADTNDLAWGGWSVGAVKHRMFHAGNSTQFTSTMNTKLSGIATSANNYSFPYTVSASASNSTVVQRHSSGYIYANYFNTSPNTVTSGVTQVCVETGNDGFIRHGTAAAIRTFVGLATDATYMRRSANSQLDMNNNDIVGVDQIFHEGDSNTYMQFHAADQWRVVTGGTERLEVNNSAVTVAGNLTATGNVTAYSDIRLKEDIKRIGNAVSKVQQLTGNTYTRNDLEDADRRYGGVIAQEVETVLPEAVNESEDGTKTVDYNALIALLVESVKELKSEIETLKRGG